MENEDDKPIFLNAPPWEIRRAAEWETDKAFDDIVTRSFRGEIHARLRIRATEALFVD